MNVLWLGPYRKSLDEFLRTQNDTPFFVEEAVTKAMPQVRSCNFLVSYGYKHLVPAEVLELFPKKAINLHISYLPWNRGADPNLWSFLEDTPKGVSIHRMTDKLDAGELLCQLRMDFMENATLKTSYEALSREMEKIFEVFWVPIREGRQEAIPQGAGGSHHRKQDAQPYKHLLKKGWDTPVRDLIGKARCHA